MYVGSCHAEGKVGDVIVCDLGAHGVVAFTTSPDRGGRGAPLKDL